MRIVGVASRPHYADHLEPILKHLDAPLVPRSDIPDNALVIVAAYFDLRALPPRTPNVYVEHGAGQSYLPYRGRLSPSYAGSPDRVYASTRLFICPNETVAARWKQVWPNTPTVIAGSPKLDRWGPNGEHCNPNEKHIAWTWHWDGASNPEMRSALLHYARHLPTIIDELRNRGYTITGHSHPRQPYHWHDVDVPYEPDPNVILDTAGILIADNTSLAYEMSALGRPTVALNAPWYRRDVHHGLRFWDLPPGPMVDHWYDIPNKVEQAITENLVSAAPSPGRQVFGVLDGMNAERAATAIQAVADSLNDL